MVPSTTVDTNPTSYPASAVVHIEVTWPNGQGALGTGTMVNANTVLTAGHVVYDAANGGWAKSIEVIPAQTGNSTPYGVAYGTYFSTFNSFIADSQRSSLHVPGDGDIGFISLDRDIGNITGTVGFLGASAQNYYVNKYGYPGQSNQMYYDFGQLNENGAGSVSGFAYWGWSTSSMSAIDGESGSSLILVLNGQTGIVGVEDVGNSSEGYAEMTTSAITNALVSFENAHPPTGITTLLPPGASAPTALGLSMPSPSPLPSPSPVASPPSPPSPPPASSHPSTHTQPSVPSPPPPPSSTQLFLDGITLAMDLNSPGGMSAVLSDSALMQDINAGGGFFNPYLDAGFSVALSALHGNHNS